MKTTLKFEGLRELEQALGQIASAATRKNVGRRALQAAGEPILQAFQSATVVESGALLASETIGTRLNRRQTRINRPFRMPVELHIGTADPAGIQQEFGNRHQAASPALRPAWDAHGGNKALGTIADALGSEIAKASRRHQARAARLAAK